MASSVVLIQGTEEFLVLRRIRDIARDHQERGYEVRHFDGSDPSQVSEMESVTGVSLFGAPAKVLAVVSNPHKLDIDWVEDLSENPKEDFSAILHVKGTLAKSTRLYKKVGASLKKRGLVLTLDQPAKHKIEDYAISFLQNELATEHGKRIEESLAKAIVRRAGSDLGVLSFEAWKLAQLEETDKVSIETVRGAVSTLAKVEINSLIDAIKTRKAERVLKVMERMRETWNTDPTMAICGMLTPVLFRWAKALAFQKMDIPPNGAAEIMGANPWYWENIVLSEARKIGFRRIRKMISTISETQKATRSGRLSPWIILETGFISALEK